MRQLAGRVAVVTGAASGIERAMAARFVQIGVSVLCPGPVATRMPPQLRLPSPDGSGAEARPLHIA